MKITHNVMQNEFIIVTNELKNEFDSKITTMKK